MGAFSDMKHPSKEQRQQRARHAIDVKDYEKWWLKTGHVGRVIGVCAVVSGGTAVALTMMQAPWYLRWMLCGLADLSMALGVKVWVAGHMPSPKALSEEREQWLKAKRTRKPLTRN